jgi:two-component system response regulator AtoC
MAGRASRFLSKPVSQEDLRKAVDQLLASTSDIHRANGTSTVGNRPELNLRTCKWHQEIAPLLGRLARYDVPVLLQGETGVGKEVLARHIHDNSLRAGKIFLKLNCAALPSELVESELFGHERGAFTGAFRSNPGKFELADGGTILLDEIGDMDLRLQAKLLQVLQDREFFRIGAKVATRVNVRVIAATHREMEACLEDGQFRQDLYYRLNVVNIVIPPLRERLDEIISLAAFFLRKHAEDGPVPEIGPELTSALHHHHWPGNIRELENLMRRYLVVKNPRAMVEDLNRVNGRGAQGNRRQVFPSARVNGSLEPGASIGDTSLGAPFARRAYSTGTPLPVSPQPLPEEDSELAKVDKVEQVRKSAEIEVIMRALYSTQWNRKRAAFQLGIDYKALLYKMKKWNIDSMRPIDAPDR